MSLEEIRRELKSWESTFKEINGRKPSKIDVEVAPAKIRALYHDYTCLRNGDKLGESTKNTNVVGKCRLKRTGFTFNKPCNPIPSMHKFSKPDPSLSIEGTSSSTLADDVPEILSSLGGVSPRISDQQPPEPEIVKTGQNQFVSYFHAGSAYEIALKRRNFCNLASVRIDGENENGKSEEDDSLENEESETSNRQTEPINKMVPFRTSTMGMGKNKRKPKPKTTTNFLRLDMKHKRYQCKALKKLKGAALKRFLFKQRTKQRS